MLTPNDAELANRADLTEPLRLAQEILTQRFPTADCVFLCGSLVRGEATPRSDLDLIVLFSQVDAAWRESFTHAGWPIECFCHDLQTAEYYFRDLDYPSGIGALMHMAIDGIATPSYFCPREIAERAGPAVARRRSTGLEQPGY